eukprot:TRINITY_DN6370_c0_g2_i4.p1 TRINITY_DN6370_c0_g2~~TRINITY_DN6370_c0_g2_i4.p1  ORF type:complete len:1509 (-),score=458.21 TRINITY_DN6370_c0_g2_i4:8-4405(-)
MEKAIVRESKYRHVFGRAWRKEINPSNLRTHSSSMYIRASDTLFAVPWETVGGALNVMPLGYAGKVKDNSCLLRAHKDPILDFTFDPFKSNCIATGSRDAIIKIWEVDAAIGTMAAAEDVTTPVAELTGHRSRILHLSYHPAVSGLLASAAGDNAVKLWDVGAASEVVSFSPWKGGTVQGVEWSPDGGQLVTSSKDKHMRTFDARAGGDATLEVMAHEGSKGFFASFMHADRVISLGFSKSSYSEVAIWDLRGTDPTTPFTKYTLGPQSTVVKPHYDADTGLLYIYGRGDKIKVMEINNTPPHVHRVSELKCKSYSDAFCLPKRSCDVTRCEISRWMTVGRTDVETVGFFVPRKTADTVFQEDIYLPAPSGAPCDVSIEQWREGQLAVAPKKSLKPEGAVSIYELSAEEGGKDLNEERERRRRATATQDEIRAAEAVAKGEDPVLPKPEVTSGELDHFLGGWSAPWTKRWASAEDDALCFYKEEESARVVFQIPFASMETIVRDEKQEGQFVLKLDAAKKNKEYRFKASSDDEAETWVRSLAACKALVEKNGSVFGTKTAPDSSASSGGGETSSAAADSAGVAAKKKEGFLDTLMPGNVYAAQLSWNRRWYTIERGTLLAYSSNKKLHSHPLEKFALSKVIAIMKVDGADTSAGGGSGSKRGDKKLYSFKVCTSGQVVHLGAESDEDRSEWIQALVAASPLEGSADGDSSSFVAAGAKEGKLMLKEGGKWESAWLRCAGKNILYYKNEMSQKAMQKMLVTDLKSVTACEGRTDFLVQKIGAGEGRVHRAANQEERDAWVSHLEFLRKQNVDLFDMLRITDQEANTAATSSTIEANVIDPVDVKNGKTPLLIEVKGRRRIRVMQVELACSSLHSRSSFVLDCGRAIFLWNGNQSPRVTKAKAADLANKIRTKERGGLSQVITLDEGKTDDNPKFWKTLGGQKEINHSTREEEGQIFVRLLRIGSKSTSRSQRIKLVHEGSTLPPREFLDTKSSTVVDCETELFVWIGKKSPVYQRKLSMLVAKKLTQEKHRPKWTSITRIPEGAETILFKEKFSNFPGMLPINVARTVAKGRIATSNQQEDIDVAALVPYHRPEPAMYDDGSGEIVNIWRIHEFDKVEVPKEEYGCFFSGDSYVILYKYRVELKGKDQHLVYFWQGSESTRNEKGTSAYMTVDLTTALGDGDHHRVEQGAEPVHFLTLFPNFFVLSGKHRPDAITDEMMFSVVCDHKDVAKSVEVPAESTNLNSMRAFLLLTAAKAFVWHGSLSNQKEQQAAAALAALVKGTRTVVTIKEGSEPTEFWPVLGGKTLDYHGGPSYNITLRHRRPPRLFSVSNASGTVKVVELFDFCQVDLDGGHCAILDAFNEVFVWFGSKSADAEKQMSMEVARDLVKLCPDHPADTPVWVGHFRPEVGRFLWSWEHMIPLFDAFLLDGVEISTCIRVLARHCRAQQSLGASEQCIINATYAAAIY